MKEEKYTNLELAIITANIAYREGNPTITDEAYDILLTKLKFETPNSELLKKGVIEKILNSNEGRKQPLPHPMYSLNKVKSVDEFVKWVKSKGGEIGDKFIVTPKFDGISLVVDELKNQCWTRGDGEVGQRSDEHYSKIVQEDPVFDLITFGEAIISKKNFEKYSNEFANARNLVAGLFNKKETSQNIEDVHYMRYGSNANHINKADQLSELNTMNAHAVPSSDFSYIGDPGIYEGYFDHLYKLWSKDYNIDGLVVEFDSTAKRNDLGREENMNPAYAIAIKFPKWSSSKITKVKGVTWGVSKQGKLKPVINIEPIELSGVTVTNVTGYNAKYIFDNNIAEGSKVEIVRSGDVIPKHINTLSYNLYNVENLSDELTECPYCETQTKWDETLTEIICPNQYCEERQISKFVHFFSILGIEDFGEPSIRQWFNEGIRTYDDFLTITVNEICQMEGWGEKSATTVLNQIEALKTKKFPLARLLHAFDLFEGKLGEKECQLIFDNLFEKDQFLLEQLGEDITDNLIKIKGIGEITAKYFQAGYGKFLSSYLSDLPFYETYLKTPIKEQAGNKYEGFSVCMTGFRDAELQSLIEWEGGKIVSGVSSKTTHLLVKDKSSTSSKMKKAEGLGITILTKDEFLNL
jgi:NAD-dependent DNA ligase